jgi:hypothetical protein
MVTVHNCGYQEVGTTRIQIVGRGAGAAPGGAYPGSRTELLTEPVTTHDGRHYPAFGAPMHPGCLQRPRLPFAIAAGGPRGIRLAARFGTTWVTEGPPTPDGSALGVASSLPGLAAELERIDAACAEVGRDPATLGRLRCVGRRSRGEGGIPLNGAGPGKGRLAGNARL